MIKLSDSSVMVIAANGSRVTFEPDELESRIIKSCLASGVRDVWIAEDISLSIEYALSQAEEQSREFSTADINSLVIRILQETGYPDVADNFKEENNNTEVQLSLDPEMVSGLINRHLGLVDDQLATVVEQVISGCQQLGLEKASPGLFLELAKSYPQRPKEKLQVEIPQPDKDSPWEVPRERIIAALGESTRELISKEILDTSGISQMFPSIKIIFKVNRFVADLGFEAPISEMVVFPHFEIPAAGINALTTEAEALHRQESGKREPLPVYLNVPDMSSFSRQYLDTPWPEGEVCCREMLSYLERMLNRQVFKISLK